jgi:16S rRNA (cytosine1402-N4)-methyltransferase
MRPLESTGQLRDAVESAVGKKFLTKTLARVFQAIRIEVNQELTHLAQGLEDALRVTLPGGRIAVISYHSLEDRIVKNFFRSHSSSSGTEMKPGPHLLNLLTRKPIAASAGEVEQNPRARSAKLRVAERREDT